MYYPFLSKCVYTYLNKQRSGSVKDVTKEPNTSNKKDGLQHNLYFDFDEPIGDFDIGGQDVGEQISNHMVVDASALKNGINTSIPGIVSSIFYKFSDPCECMQNVEK